MTARILIADSDRETANRCGEILSPLGYEIQTVSGPIEAVIGVIEANRPDLVLMDITIPVNGIGMEVARSIGMRFDLPLIYLTGDAGADTIRRARESGPYGYILKPVKDHDLVSNVDSALHRHQLERELRESELKFRTLTEHNNAPVYVIQGEHFVYVNKAFTRLLEYPADECCRMAFWNVIHPDYRQMAMNRGLARQRGEKVPDRYEVKLLTKSEQTLWAELSVALIEYQGRPASLGTAIDITGRKMAEEALRHSEEQYRLLVENANEAIAVFQDLTIRFANRKMSEASEYPIDELIGRSFLDLIHLDDRELVVQNHLQRIQGQDLPEVYSFRFVTKSGEVKWAEINTAFIDWEGKTAVLSFLTDVTERKMMEEEIRRHNQRLEYLLTVAKIGIDIIDEEYNILYIDPAWSKIYGKPDGRKCYEYFMDRDAPCDNCGVPQAIAERRIVIKEEILVKEDNRIVEVHTIPFEEGGRTLAAEFNIDITERKRLEQQLVHAQKMESVGRLAGGIAHDFNNILQAIIGLSHIALSEAAANRPSSEEIEQILTASRRATALVKQLLAFSSRGAAAADNRRAHRARDRIGRRPVERVRGPGPDRADHHEPLRQFPRRHARRRIDRYTHGKLPPGARPDGTCAPAEKRRLRRALRKRHGHRHGEGGQRTRVRTFLHDQGDRQGDGAGAGDGVRNRQTARGMDRARELRRQRDGLSHTPAGLGEAVASPGRKIDRHPHALARRGHHPARRGR
ncbi:MAG: PAS domain S-box protein [Spirochaetes bacterium]|nr:PAS domain S-box protein [Spirochaetota bacterium]